MKRIYLLMMIACTMAMAKGQHVSDYTMDAYLNTYIIPNAVNAITATKMNTMLNYIVDSKLNKDSLNVTVTGNGDTLFFAFADHTDTIAGFTNWQLTGDDIANTNAGDVTLNGQVFVPDIAASGAKYDWRVAAIGIDDRLFPKSIIDLYNEQQDSLIKNPSAYTTFGRDTLTGKVYLINEGDMIGSVYSSGSTCDLDGDGEIWSGDIDYFLNMMNNYEDSIYSYQRFQKYDLDGNGEINLMDFSILARIGTPGLFDLTLEDSIKMDLKTKFGLMYGIAWDDTTRYWIRTDLNIDSNLTVEGAVKFPGIANTSQSNILYYDESTGDITYDVSAGVGIPDHGDLPGLTDDDHEQYALLSGRSDDSLHIDYIIPFDNDGVKIVGNLNIENSIDGLTGYITLGSNGIQATNITGSSDSYPTVIFTLSSGLSFYLLDMTDVGTQGVLGGDIYLGHKDYGPWRGLYTTNILDDSNYVFIKLPIRDYDTSLVTLGDTVAKRYNPILWQDIDGVTTNTNGSPIEILTADNNPYSGNHDLTFSTISASTDGANLAIGFKDAVGDTSLAAIVVRNEGETSANKAGWMDLYFRQNSGTNFEKKFSFGDNYVNDESMMKIYDPYTEEADDANYTVLWNSETDNITLANVRPGYSIPIMVGNWSTPADATNYYFGGIAANAPGTTADEKYGYFLRRGTVKAISLISYASGVAGSNESWIMSIRINNSTDYPIDTLYTTDPYRRFININMDIPVNAGDRWEIKTTTPSWSTNPTTILMGGYIYVEQ